MKLSREGSASNGGVEHGVNQNVAENVANAYLQKVLGVQYAVSNAVRGPLTWRFLIHCQWPGLNQPAVAGTLEVDAQTGEVIALSADAIQDTQERAALRVARERGELPRDQNGYILPYLAKVRVNGYMGRDVVFFASGEGRPEWKDGDPPCWRVATALRLRGLGKVCELGTVDVNALTGEVIPLTEAQIKTMQRQARDATARAQRSTTTAG